MSTHCLRLSDENLNPNEKNKLEQTEFLPDWASPPGDTILELLELRNISKEQLAELVPSVSVIEHLLTGRAKITIKVARELEQVFQVSFRFWLRRESQYRASLVRNNLPSP